MSPGLVCLYQQMQEQRYLLLPIIKVARYDYKTNPVVGLLLAGVIDRLA